MQRQIFVFSLILKGLQDFREKHFNILEETPKTDLQIHCYRDRTVRIFSQSILCSSSPLLSFYYAPTRVNSLNNYGIQITDLIHSMQTNLIFSALRCNIARHHTEFSLVNVSRLNSLPIFT